MKRCTHCHQPKPASAFSRNARAHDGLQSWCKACVADYHRSHPRKTPQRRLPGAQRGYYLKNRERVRWRNALKKYGVTAAEYADLLAYQHGCCAICLTPPPAGKILAVDHDHATGRVRGLLCDRCNFAIGLLGDYVGRILVAAAYVQHHGATAERVEMAAWVNPDRPDVGRNAAQAAMPTLWDSP